MKFYQSGLLNLNKKIKKKKKKKLGRSYKSKIDMFYPTNMEGRQNKLIKIQNSDFIFLED